jgi:hypothetical protein
MAPPRVPPVDEYGAAIAAMEQELARRPAGEAHDLRVPTLYTIQSENKLPGGSSEKVDSNIVVEFPNVFLWLLIPKNPFLRASPSDALRAYAKAMKDYQDSIEWLVREIGASHSGGFLLDEIRRGKKRVFISPLDDGHLETNTVFSLEDATMDIEKVRDRVGKVVAPPKMGKSMGATTTIFFTPAAHSFISNMLRGLPGFDDEVLFHEMVHAAAAVNGQVSDRAIDSSFHGSESEFMAVFIADIYTSEKRPLASLRANYSLFKPPLRNNDTFLDDFNFQGVSARDMIGRFSQRQPVFFRALAAIPNVKFNPMRLFKAEIDSKGQKASQRNRR